MGISIFFMIFASLIKSLGTMQNIWSLRVYQNYYKKNYFFSLTKISETKKSKKWLLKIKKTFQMDDVDINKIVRSKTESYSTKNEAKKFIGYNDNDVIRPLCLRLPQMTGYAGKSDENVTMSFRVNNKTAF